MKNIKQKQMRIEDNGFIVFVKKFEENSLLVRILSKENGLISGYIKHTKKDINQYQLGNLVIFVWSAKNNNQLGSLKIELIKSYLSIFITNKFYLDLIENITISINELIYERYLENNLYKNIENIFNSIIENKTKNEILKEFLYFENTLLNVLGTGIIFEKNTPIYELYYISPKTGLAVSKTKGEPYKDKLFLFPQLFLKNEILEQELQETFDILDFFLKKHLNQNENILKYKKIATLNKKLFEF